MMNMKKMLALLLAVVMVVGMIPFGAMAEEAEPVTHIETCLEGCALEDCACTCHAAPETPVEEPKQEQPPVAPASLDDTQTQETPVCTCTPVEGVHAEACALYVKPEAPVEEPKTEETPVCTCTPVEGVHADGCALYVKPEEPVCTCTPVEGVHAEGCVLYVAPVVPEEEVFNVEEAYAYVMSLESDEAVLEYLNTLDQEDLDALIAYAQKMDPPEIPVSKVFTKAGPFMPAVNVAPVRRMLFAGRNTTSGESENGLILDKDVVSVNDDGTYTLRLEAYVTGKTVTSTVTTAQPADIVLVLDQSGSMAYDFNGNDTSSNSARRQYAMKQAVVNFIGSVQDKYSDTCDNRMAIVTFGSNASELLGWTFVDEAGETALKNEVNSLPNTPSGATNVAAGMEKAETLMGDGYNYSGSNTTRQKVVIVFTDGVPTTSTEFSTTVATSAIASAKNLKDDGITVYTVGIFTGVDKNQLHGEKIDMTLSGDTPCDGTVGSRWGAGLLNQLFGDVRAIDVAAGNRFLNYLSSNFKSATEIGITSYSEYTHSGWRITKNFTRDHDSYYLTAEDSTSLNNIFQQISNNIQTGSASMTLGTETVVQDIVSDYFTIPGGASSVKVYTSDYSSDKTWGKDVAANYTVNVSGKNVSVSGFDFTTNYVDLEAENGRQENDPNAAGNFYGRKLILEIVVKPENNFLGGNGVPTNSNASGVYDGGKLVEKFPVPNTDVALKILEIGLATTDQNIYLSNDADLAALVTSLDQRINGTNNAYVDVKYEIKDGETVIGTVTIPAGSALPSEIVWTEAADQDMTPNLDAVDTKNYTIVATATPTSSGSYDPTTNTKTELVNVFKPVVYFQDSEINAGDAPVYAEQNLVKVEWKDVNNTLASTVTMHGTEPQLVYTYNPVAAPLNAEREVQITAVATTAQKTINLDDITFIRNACNLTNGCGYPGSTVDMSEEGYINFIVHLKTCDLVITKIVNNQENNADTFVFTVTGPNSFSKTVVINGAGSVTIADLPIGEYTVTEDTAWSWRYSCSASSIKKTIAPNNNNFEFTNTFKPGSKWLTDTSYAKNLFGTKSATIK